MSRIGNKVIVVPAGVTVEKTDSNFVTVKGPRGVLEFQFNSEMIIDIQEGQVVIKRPSEQKHHKQLHGTTRALISNMVIGVSEGFKKELEIVGRGYEASLQGKTLKLKAGYSHPNEFQVEEGLTVEVPENTRIIITGNDKCQVGQFAAVVRAVRKPEPYKGKGIRYKGEAIIRKEGKTAKK